MYKYKYIYVPFARMRTAQSVENALRKGEGAEFLFGQRNMKKQKPIASGKDLLVLVLASCIVTVAATAIGGSFPVMPLYVGMLGVFAYTVFLAVYFSIFLRKRAGVFKEEREHFEAGDLTGFLAESPHPSLLCSKNGTVEWCNKAFLQAAGVPSLEKDVTMGDICRKVPEGILSLRSNNICQIGESLYHYDFVRMPSGGEYRLVSFRNVTEWNKTAEAYRKLRELYDGDRTAVAYIIIDNVEDMLQNVQEQFRDATSQVADLLREWIWGMGGVIRSYERDKYIAVFNRFGLEKCIRNRFDILDRVRVIHAGEAIPMTVSIGVSCIEKGSLGEREELAKAALDIALQRGGDQVVYKNESGTDYYGGKTKAIYKRANVRARTVGTHLIEMMDKAGNVLIMGHKYGDYDSFGATVGMARFAMHLSVPSVHIVANRSDTNLRACFDKILSCPEYKEIFISAEDAPSYVRPDTLLVVVDVNNFPHTECPKLLDMVENVAIIDHHTQSAVFNKDIALAYIEPSASSASEMVAEILEQHLGAKRLLKEEAELMLSGILLDTKQLVRNTGTRTFGAALFLRGEGADPGETNEFFKNEVTDLKKQAQFLTHVITYKEKLAIAVCEGDTDASYRVIAAKAADRLLSGRGISASFAIVTIGGKVHISARSDGTINVAKILEELHGGGHFDSAGAQIEEDAGEETIEKLKNAIDKYSSMFENER